MVDLVIVMFNHSQSVTLVSLEMIVKMSVALGPLYMQYS